MSNKIKFVIFTVIAISALFFAAYVTAQNSDTSADIEQLFGSWMVEVSTPSQGSFPALLTFTSDGSVISAESNSLESAGHGNWVINDDGEVAYTFIALFGNEDGENMGQLKVIGALQFDAETQSWSGPFSINVSDPSGAVVFSDEGTFTLVRIEVESLD